MSEPTHPTTRVAVAPAELTPTLVDATISQPPSAAPVESDEVSQRGYANIPCRHRADSAGIFFHYSRWSFVDEHISCISTWGRRDYTLTH